jgi:hypothetical protein
MHCYQVGYGSHEDSLQIFCMHEEKMSAKMLANHVDAALVAQAQSLYKLAKRKKIPRGSYPDPGCLYLVNFSELLGPVFYKTMEKRGFTFPEFTATDSVSGWANVFKRGRESFAGARENRLRRKIAKECPDAKGICKAQETAYRSQCKKESKRYEAKKSREDRLAEKAARKALEITD